MFHCPQPSHAVDTHTDTHIHTNRPPAVVSMTTVLSSHCLWVKLIPVLCLCWSFCHLSFSAAVCLLFWKDIWLALSPTIKGSCEIAICTHTHTQSFHALRYMHRNSVYTHCLHSGKGCNWKQGCRKFCFDLRNESLSLPLSLYVCLPVSDVQSL